MKRTQVFLVIAFLGLGLVFFTIGLESIRIDSLWGFLLNMYLAVISFGAIAAITAHTEE